MVIKKTGTYAARSASKVRETDLRNTEQTRLPPPRAKSPPEDLYRVEFSSEYQEIDHLKKAITEIPDVRVERVDDCRERIAGDAYIVDPGQVSGKILDEQW